MDQETVKLLESVAKEPDYFNKATLLHHLKNEKKIRIKDLAEKLNLKPAYICHILRLSKLPDIVKDGYYSKTVSLSHLFIIARLETHEQMLAAYEKILGKGLTALQTEALIREMLYDVETEGKYLEKSVIGEFHKSLKDIGQEYSVKLIQTRVRGRLIIEVKGGLDKTTPALLSVLQRMKD
jgi:hypothetical protein